MFGLDAQAVQKLEDTSVYTVGLFIQIWYIVMLVRNLVFTLITCKKGTRDTMFILGMSYYWFSLCDMLILGGLVI